MKNDLAREVKDLLRSRGNDHSWCRFSPSAPKPFRSRRFCHTYASMLLKQEINPKIVQKLPGHRDVSTTLGVYTHVVPEVFSGVTTDQGPHL